MGKIHNITMFLLRAAAVCLLGAALIGSWYLLKNREVSRDAEFIFVGTRNDADCSLLLNGDFCVMIDTGEKKDGPHILEVLQSKEIDRIDCLILTHPDKDHIGGALLLTDEIPIDQVFIPPMGEEKAEIGNRVKEKPSLYEEVLEQFAEKEIPVKSLFKEHHLRYGDLDIRIFPPKKPYYKKDNDYSLAALVKHGRVSAFYAGDAEKERLGELLKTRLPEVDLYKTAHHGRKSKRGGELIEKLKPRYAVVTSEKAEQGINEAFRRTGTEVFTSVNRDLSFHSNGEQILTD